MQILQSLDFKEWRPAVICVETISYAPKKEQKKVDNIFKYLKNNNYRVYADTYINTIFVDNTRWSKMV